MTHITTSEPRQIYFPEKQKADLEPLSLTEPAKGEVRIRFARSLMSTGTENIVFNRLFEPGSHWDKFVRYPYHPGYSSVGTVEAVGPEVKSLRPGMRIACSARHKSHDNWAEDRCYPIPDGIPFEKAVWFALAKIAFMGARAAEYRVGDTVMVIGAGPIGQMSIRWARVAGAKSIIVVDPVEGRLALAKQGGATATFSVPIAEAREAVLAAGHGKLPRVVIDSTGNAQVFAAALGLTASHGTVVILGDTGSPSQQFLTSDVIIRGLRIVGAHDSHTTAEWNDATIASLFFSLVEDGRFPIDGLTSHRFAPEECMEAYVTANRDRAKTMGIIFEWEASA